MPNLIGCTFTKGLGWRTSFILVIPKTLIKKRVASKNGVLWIAANKTPRVGRFINPATLLKG